MQIILISDRLAKARSVTLSLRHLLGQRVPRARPRAAATARPLLAHPALRLRGAACRRCSA